LSILAILYITVATVSAVPLYDSITLSSPTIEPGQPWMLNGSAPGYQDIQVWIFGSGNVEFFTKRVERNGSYSLIFTPERTRTMIPGRYWVVLQFPNEQEIYDVQVNNGWVTDVKKPTSQQQLFSVIPGTESPVNPFAYATLIRALDDPSVNDTYADIFLSVTQPLLAEQSREKEPLTIHPVDDHTVGDRFVIEGTTNISAGGEILIQIMPSTFTPGPKIPERMQDGTTGIVHIMDGDNGENTWSFPVDTAHWLPEEYLVSVTPIKENVTAATTFRLYSGSIRLDPIGNCTIGDPISVTGITTADSSTPIMVQLLYQPVIRGKSMPGSLLSSCNSREGRSFLVNRSAGKWWSAVIDTNGCSQGTYRVNAFSASGQIQEDFRQVELLAPADQNAERNNTSSLTAEPTTGTQPATTPAASFSATPVVLALGFIGACMIAQKKRGS